MLEPDIIEEDTIDSSKQSKDVDMGLPMTETPIENVDILQDKDEQHEGEIPHETKRDEEKFTIQDTLENKEEEIELDESLFIQDSDQDKQRLQEEEIPLVDKETKEEQIEELLDITQIEEETETVDNDKKDNEVWDIEFDELIIEEDDVVSKDNKGNKENGDEDDIEIEIFLEEDKDKSK